MSEPTKHAATREPKAAAAPKRTAPKPAVESDAAFWSGFSSGAADREKTRAAAESIREKIAALAPANEPEAELDDARANDGAGWEIEASSAFDALQSMLDAQGPGIWSTDPKQRERVVRSWARVGDHYVPGGLGGAHPVLAALWDTAFWATPRALRHWSAYQAEKKNAADAAEPETPKAGSDAL